MFTKKKGETVTVVLNLPKRKHSIKLEDSPNSPQWTFDLTDSEITRLFPIFMEARKIILLYSEGKLDDVAELAGAYREIIVESLGRDAYNAILDYVTDGSNDAENSTVYLAPVVGHIFKLYSQAMTMRRDRLAEKYIGLDIAN